MEMKLCSYKGRYSGYEKEVIRPFEETGEMDMTAITKPWFKPKNGSVFPLKRKTVKRMMFDSAVQFFSSDCVRTLPPLKVAKLKEGKQVKPLPISFKAS